MPTILNIIPTNPLPPRSGGDVCVLNIMKAQKLLGFDVDILCFSKMENGDCESNVPPWGNAFIVNPPGRWEKVIFSIRNPYFPYWVSSRYSPIMRDKVIELTANNKYDIVQIEHTNMGQYAKYVNSGNIFLNVHSLSMLAFQRFVANESRLIRRLALKLDAQRLARWESNLLGGGGFNGIFFLSKKDMDKAKSIVNLPENSRLLPLPIDTHMINVMSVGEENNILIVGSMDNPSNEDAARWFATRVFNKILKKVPSSRLIIVGKNVNGRIGDLVKLKNVSLASDVDDLTPYYRKAALVVVPVRGGAGARTKLLEAMAHGKPVVSTPIGVESMSEFYDARAGRPYVLAETEDSFAENCIDLLANDEMRNAIGRAARNYIERFYSVEACATALKDMYFTL